MKGEGISAISAVSSNLVIHFIQDRSQAANAIGYPCGFRSSLLSKVCRPYHGALQP